MSAMVAERIRSEQAARESQLRLAGLIDSAMDAIITVDAGHRIVLFNPAAERSFGWSANEVIGRPIDGLIPVGLREAHREHIRRFAATGVTARRMGSLDTLTAVRRNGEEFPIEASISHLEIAGSHHFTDILRDVTERKSAESELEDWRLELEARVRRRTAELAATHELLREEIVERQRLETEIAGVTERERRRLGQDLHDGVGQSPGWGSCSPR
jgi:PAS domain S-box-containing protein